MKARCPFNDYQDIRQNLPEFIRFVSSTPVTPRFTWPEFARTWANSDRVVHASYESLRNNTVGELTRLIAGLTNGSVSSERAEEVVEKHSFKRVKAAAERDQTGRAETSFVREGALGGWRKHFTHEAKYQLKLCGFETWMQFLGYEDESE